MAKVCIISTVHNALDNRIFYREACSLNKFGYQVTLLAVHDKAENLSGIQIIPLKRLLRSRRPFLWLTVLRLALATKADIYHIHDPELLFITPVLRMISHKPVIYDVHESLSDFIEIKDDIQKSLRSFLAWSFRWLEPMLAHLQSGLIFADDQIASSFHSVKKPKLTLFNYPLDTFLNSAINSVKKPELQVPIVLYLGGLKRNRGISLMLDAFSIVLKSFPGAQLLLVGPFAPESLQEETRVEIKKRNITDSIIITGAVPFEIIRNYLSIASVGWIPFPPVKKYQKNIPTKLFEYMAYAVPIVSSDLIPIRQFIETEKNGLLVQADDPNAQASAIIRILNNPQFGEILGKNGQSTVINNYRWSDMEKRLIDFYQQILLLHKN